MPYVSPYYTTTEQRRVQSRRAASARPQESLRASATEPQDSSKFLSNTDWGQVANLASIGASGYTQGAAGVNDFSIDPYAGLKGSAQGLSQGGVVGAIIGGVASQIGTFSEVNKKLKNLNTSVELEQRGVLGEPLYSGESYLAASDTSKALAEGERTIKKSFDPGTRIFGGLFGTRKKLRRKRRQLNREIREAQTQFNENSQNFDEQQIALDEYAKRMDATNRMYNLYKV